MPVVSETEATSVELTSQYDRPMGLEDEDEDEVEQEIEKIKSAMTPEDDVVERTHSIPNSGEELAQISTQSNANNKSTISGLYYTFISIAFISAGVYIYYFLYPNKDSKYQNYQNINTANQIMHNDNI